MNPSQMFREETFTDRRTGSVKMLTPVDKDGNDDHKREIIFMGEAQPMTPMGAMAFLFRLRQNLWVKLLKTFLPLPN